MKIFIKQATVVDSESVWNGKTVDIRIIDGLIAEIAAELTYHEDERLVTAQGLHVSQGWFDLRADFADPGYEHRESIDSGCNAAAYGGYTAVALSPLTQPVIDNKSVVEYIVQRAKETLVDVYPIGSLSHNAEGKELSEMYDMKEHGVVAFSDDKRSIVNSNLLNIALQYTKTLNTPVFSFPEDRHLAGDNSVNEGLASTRNGMKGIPSVAEYIGIQRDIAIADYNNAPLHFTGVSTKEGVELIRQSKKAGKAITADVAAYQLYFDDNVLDQFDSNYKVKPAIRSTEDRKALLEALKDGTIDIVCSDHKPQDIESKNVEFDFARYGMASLEANFGALVHAAKEVGISLSRIIDSISIAPRKLLNIPTNPIKEGYPAQLTLFQPDLTWTFDEKHIQSKSRNYAFINKPLSGKPLAIINKGRIAVSE